MAKLSCAFQYLLIPAAFVFIYIQTGSGKTYTIWGPVNALLEENLSSDQQGLTPRVFQRLFTRINEVVYAKTDITAGSKGITAFIVKKGMPGELNRRCYVAIVVMDHLHNKVADMVKECPIADPFRLILSQREA